jgi:hypothetical protein
MRLAILLGIIAIAWCIWAVDRLNTENLYLKAQFEELQAKHNALVDINSVMWGKLNAKPRSV